MTTLSHNEMIKTVTSLVSEFQNWDVLRGLPFDKMVERLMPVFQARFEESVLPSPRPLSVHLEISSKCNCHCKMCRQWTWASRSQDSNLDTGRVFEVLDDLVKIGVETVTISGGDPMVNPDFSKIICYAKRIGLTVSVITDGQALTPRLADSINECANWVRFSIDGADKIAYERIRGVPGGFDRVCQSLRLFDSTTRQALVGINYVVQRDNYTDLESIVALGKQMSVDVVLFKLAHGQGDYLLQPKEVIRLQHTLADSLDRIPSDFTNARQFQKLLCEQSTVQDISDGMPIRSFYSTNETKCFAPFLFCVISSHGDVYPCDYLCFDTRPEEQFAAERAKYCIGNIRTRSIHELLGSSNFRRITDTIFNIDPVQGIHECGCCTRFYMINSIATSLYDMYCKTRQFHSHDEANILLSESLSDFRQPPYRRYWL